MQVLIGQEVEGQISSFIFLARGKGAKCQLLKNLCQPSDVSGKGEQPGTAQAIWQSASRVQDQKKVPT